MQILSIHTSSRCTDGAVVLEYALSEPVDDDFISILKDFGELHSRQLGAIQMFTLQADEWLCLKGLSGDSLLYVTHQKRDRERAENLIEEILTRYCAIRNSTADT